MREIFNTFNTFSFLKNHKMDELKSVNVQEIIKNHKEPEFQ